MRERLIQLQKRGGSALVEAWQHASVGHRSHSRRSWHELTPLPLAAGLASANCAARLAGLHIEVGLAASTFASVLVGSVKQQQLGGRTTSTTDK